MLREKLAHITLLTGSVGAGKSVLARKLAPHYDLVVGTDTGGVVDGKYVSLSKEEKVRVRAERTAAVLEAHRAGKRVLVEGFPEGHVKHPGVVAEADRVLHLATPHLRGILDVARRSRERGTPMWPDIKMAIQTRLADGKYLREIEQQVGKDRFVRITRDYVEKHAARPGSKEDMRAQKKVDAHFGAIDPRTKWDQLPEDVRRKSFVATLAKDPRTDPKLLRHVDAMHRLTTGAPVATVTGDRGQEYTIKRLRGGPELGCTCGDWRYVRSVQPTGSPERQCKHIRGYLKEMTTGEDVPAVRPTGAVFDRFKG